MEFVETLIIRRKYTLIRDLYSAFFISSFRSLKFAHIENIIVSPISDS